MHVSEIEVKWQCVTCDDLRSSAATGDFSCWTIVTSGIPQWLFKYYTQAFTDDHWAAIGSHQWCVVGWTNERLSFLFYPPPATKHKAFHMDPLGHRPFPSSSCSMSGSSSLIWTHNNVTRHANHSSIHSGPYVSTPTHHLRQNSNEKHTALVQAAFTMT